MTRDMSGTARELALRLRTSGSVYERITKKELGELFSVGRFSEGLAQEVQDVLQEHGLACIPRVGDANVFNVFDWRHPIAKAALAIARPEDTSEGALVELVRVYQRYEQGKDLRSDDVPWIEAFDLFLQSVLYKPLRGWEDLRDDRHPAELAKGSGRRARPRGRRRPGRLCQTSRCDCRGIRSSLLNGSNRR
jgi:hypothetical protein